MNMLHKTLPKSILKMKEMGTLVVIHISEFFSFTYSCNFNTDMAVRMYYLPLLCLVTIALKSNPCTCDWKLISLIHYCPFSFSWEIALKGRARGIFFYFFKCLKWQRKGFFKLKLRKCFLISLENLGLYHFLERILSKESFLHTEF